MLSFLIFQIYVSGLGTKLMFSVKGSATINRRLFVWTCAILQETDKKGEVQILDRPLIVCYTVSWKLVSITGSVIHPYVTKIMGTTVT